MLLLVALKRKECRGVWRGGCGRGHIILAWSLGPRCGCLSGYELILFIYLYFIVIIYFTSPTVRLFVVLSKYALYYSPKLSKHMCGCECDYEYIAISIPIPFPILHRIRIPICCCCRLDFYPSRNFYVALLPLA